VRISYGDYVARQAVSNWTEQWDKLGEQGQAVTTFGMASVNSIKGTALPFSISFSLFLRSKSYSSF